MSALPESRTAVPLRCACAIWVVATPVRFLPALPTRSTAWPGSNRQRGAPCRRLENGYLSAPQSTAWKLLIEDAGQGFPLGQDSASFGIRGMGKRAESIGATLDIREFPGKRNIGPGEGTASKAPDPIKPARVRPESEVGT